MFFSMIDTFTVTLNSIATEATLNIEYVEYANTLHAQT